MSKFGNRKKQEFKSDDVKKVRRRKSSILKNRFDLTDRNGETTLTRKDLTSATKDITTPNLKNDSKLEELNTQIPNVDCRSTVTENQKLAVEEESEVVQKEQTSNNLSGVSPEPSEQDYSPRKEVDRLVEAGLHLYQNQEYSKSVTIFKKALDRESKNIKANYWLGMSYYCLSQIDRSVEYFVMASPSEDNQLGYVEAFFWLGEIYRQQDKPKLAKENYQKILSLAPNSSYTSMALEQLSTIKFNSLFG